MAMVAVECSLRKYPTLLLLPVSVRVNRNSRFGIGFCLKASTLWLAYPARLAQHGIDILILSTINFIILFYFTCLNQIHW